MSDWSSDVCSSDLAATAIITGAAGTGLALVAQGEVQRAGVGLHAGIAQRLFEVVRAMLQHLQRFRLVGRNHRGQAAVMADLELDLDLAEIARIELDRNLVEALGGAALDLHGNLLAGRHEGGGAAGGGLGRSGGRRVGGGCVSAWRARWWP